MDQIKPAATPTPNDHDAHDEAGRRNEELRSLSDLELVACGGGEGGYCW